MASLAPGAPAARILAWLAPGVLAVSLLGSSSCVGGEEGEPWLDDLAAESSLDPAALDVAAGEVWRAVFDAGRLDALSEWSRADRAPRVVAVTARGDGAPRVVLAGGRGFARALERATSRLRELDPELERASGARRWARVEVVDRVLPVGEEEGDDEPFASARYGLAWPNAEAAVLADERVVLGVCGAGGRLRDAALERLDARRRTALAAGVSAAPRWRFETAGRFHDGVSVTRLFRGHPVHRPLSSAEALRLAAEGADWLRAAVRPDGRFVYSYLPKTDRVADRYNMVRHAGTIYAMLDVYETTRDEALLAAAERALEELARRFRPYTGEGAIGLEFAGKVKLGGVALAAVACAEHVTVTGRREWLERARALCRYLVSNQSPDGRFVHQREWPTWRVIEFESQYYPGEALLALLRTHALDGDPRWLDAAERGARWLIEVRDRGRSDEDLPHDHWLLYALDELHRKRPNPLWLRHAERIARAILARQNRVPEAPDLEGSFYRPPRSTPTSTRMEGLAATWRLARDHELASLARACEDGIERGTVFWLACRLTPPRALLLPRPEAALGAFTRDLESYEIRIDYVQHAISALMLVHRLLEAEGRSLLRRAS